MKTINIRIQVTDSTPKYKGVRCLHKVEGGNQNTDDGMPEVTPPLYGTGLNMTKEIQQVAYDLFLYFNTAVQAPDWNPKKLWTNVHGTGIAFCNGTGFDDPDNPRRNYVLNENLTAEYPKYDKQGRLCSGSFIHGLTEIDHTGREILRCKPGIHGIDATKPMPSIQTIVDNNWYFYAVSMDAPTKISHFPQGKGQPVAIPFVFDRDVIFERKFFDVWEADNLPDPLKIYKSA